MEHDPLVLALMVALLALQVSFKLLDSRARKKSNNSAGHMSKEAWMLIFNELFDEKLEPFEEKHEQLIVRLDKMTEGFQGNRQIIINKMDDLRNVLQEILNAVYRKGRT